MIPEFGVTPWGRAWLKTLESPTAARPNPLLPKARSLARNHKVQDLQTSAGRVSATVADKTPRAVEVTFDPWPKEVASAVTRALTAARSPATTPEGDLPDELIAALAVLGAELAPPQHEWATVCTCTSRHSPCAHVSACIYTLIHAVDEQPAVAITLRTNLNPDNSIDASAVRTDIDINDLDPQTFYNAAFKTRLPQDIT
ncbi:hypothetical protein CVS54_01425 [Microbacterium oxydans]|uniref:SWIM-type domain-containing protein n=1 Tax=Microbacterium oxydans TaxID=82380 RepID=A0A3Q9J4E5_9MICO|nr:hypothetical protein [Microbacterium oxydans]AZS40102.1 hypothetical protein CVS54_01425 [Microbacterium oxydans]